MNKRRRFFRALGLATALALLAFFIGVLLTPLPPLTPAESIRLEDRQGVPLYEYTAAGMNRSRWLDLAAISPWLVRAMIFAEDRHFFRHPGVNPGAMLRALSVNLRRGRVIYGGSTITMQLAKILRRRAQRSLGEKLREVLLAFRLEWKLGKRSILNQYLNRVYFGNQFFGCEAAARGYFGVPASDLTLAQAAFLAAITPSPSFLNPFRRRGDVESRTQRLLAEMHRRGWITAEELRLACSENIVLQRPRNPFLAPHFVFQVLDEEEKHIYGIAAIRTTLDWYLQRDAHNVLHAYLANLAERGVKQGAVLVLDNRSGQVLVWIGSADFWNEENDGQVDGCVMLRQPGSALKPFLYATALAHGYSPATVLPDLPLVFRDGNKSYVPRNYSDSFSGPKRARVALASSLNVPAVYLLDKLGTSVFQQCLHQFGFTSLKRGDRYYGLGMALGSGEVSLSELVQAFATLARGGVNPVMDKVLRFRTWDGRLILPAVSNGRRVVDERVAFLITSILSDNNARGLGFSENSPLQFPYQVAVKTGTSEGFRDNFCVGYTREFTVGVWVGDFSGKSMHSVSGVTGAGPIFHSIMNLLYRQRFGAIPYGYQSLAVVPRGMVRSEVCPLSGMLPTAACPGRVSEYFLEEQVPQQVCTWHVRCVVDSRNGLLAGERTPPAFRSESFFFQLPAVYRKWGRENGLATVPERYSDLAEHEFRIAFPTSGSIFQTLPDLPAHYQTVRLELRTSVRSQRVIWLVDNQQLARLRYPYQCRWALARGYHEITAQTEDRAWSDRVRVFVQ